MVCTTYVMVYVLESSNYFSLMGPPKEVSSQDVDFSKCLGKRKEGRRENGNFVCAADKKHILQKCFSLNDN